MRYLVTCSYDGTNYAGFQKQPGYISIQTKLEDALSYINRHQQTKIIAAGRTDKGVHALGQTFHVDIDIEITEEKLKRAINSLIPDDIHVIKCVRVKKDFHARYMVKSKEYCYLINMGEYNPLAKNYVYQYNRQLNVSLMKEAIKNFIGCHDFTSFISSEDKRENHVRTIMDAKIDVDDNLVKISFIGDGFCKYQVRNMVGYLIRVGEGKLLGCDIEKILNDKDRRLASITAHACGLYLVSVRYDIDNYD